MKNQYTNCYDWILAAMTPRAIKQRVILTTKGGDTMDSKHKGGYGKPKPGK